MNLNVMMTDLLTRLLEVLGPIFILYLVLLVIRSISKPEEKVEESNSTVEVKSEMPMYQGYVKEIESLVGIILDSDISQKLKSLVEVLQKVPQRYFDEERLGKYYVPELLSALKTYCNLSEKDDAAKANILESIEVVTGVSKSILGDLDENEKMKLEINSDVLSQMAKMDGYLSDTTLKEKTYPAS